MAKSLIYLSSLSSTKEQQMTSAKFGKQEGERKFSLVSWYSNFVTQFVGNYGLDSHEKLLFNIFRISRWERTMALPGDGNRFVLMDIVLMLRVERE